MGETTLKRERLVIGQNILSMVGYMRLHMERTVSLFLFIRVNNVLLPNYG